MSGTRLRWPQGEKPGSPAADWLLAMPGRLDSQEFVNQNIMTFHERYRLGFPLAMASASGRRGANQFASPPFYLGAAVVYAASAGRDIPDLEFRHFLAGGIFLRRLTLRIVDDKDISSGYDSLTIPKITSFIDGMTIFGRSFDSAALKSCFL